MDDAMYHHDCRMTLGVGSREQRIPVELGVPAVRIVSRSLICSHWMCLHPQNYASGCWRSCTCLFANRVG
jgi:hypothetical protein